MNAEDVKIGGHYLLKLDTDGRYHPLLGQYEGTIVKVIKRQASRNYFNITGCCSAVRARELLHIMLEDNV